jgi:hypothetical protein
LNQHLRRRLPGQQGIPFNHGVQNRITYPNILHVNNLISGQFERIMRMFGK